MRRVYIRTEDLDRWGCTANCRRCHLMRQGQSARGYPHTEACRARIEAAMQESGDIRFEAAANRIADHIADRMQRGDAAAASGSLGAGAPHPAEEEPNRAGIGAGHRAGDAARSRAGPPDNTVTDTYMGADGMRAAGAGDAMLECLYPDMGPGEAEEANETL